MQMQILMRREKQLFAVRRYSLLQDETGGKSELDSWREESRRIPLLQKWRGNLEGDAELSDEPAVSDCISEIPVIRWNDGPCCQGTCRTVAFRPFRNRQNGILEFISAVLGMRELERRLIDEINERQKAISDIGKTAGTWWENTIIMGVWIVGSLMTTWALRSERLLLPLFIFIIGLILARLGTRVHQETALFVWHTSGSDSIIGNRENSLLFYLVDPASVLPCEQSIYPLQFLRYLAVQLQSEWALERRTWSITLSADLSWW